MAEYIEREALMVALCKEIVGDGDYYNGKDDMQDQIRDMVSRFPSADVAPVRNGRWEKVAWWQHQNRYECNECSICGCRVKPKFTYNYCPHCGADMRGRNDE